MRVTEDATITSKGQVTISKEIQEHLDLQGGDQLEFVLTDDGELTSHRKPEAMTGLRDVREQLAPLSIDVDDLRHQSNTEWGAVEKRNVE